MRKVLVIEHGHFYGRYDYFDGTNQPATYRYERQGSPMALWGLISCIHHAASMVTSTTKDVPRQYDDGDAQLRDNPTNTP